ncbi:putative ribonuclease H-like domain-containing protein [Tanacetum coccineum]
MGFLVYQMVVKSAFLYGTIEEEVYVYQPLGFVDPAHPNKVYKVIKALYGLHQAPKAWYETLSSFLLENGFRRGTIDQTLFIKKNKSDIMLVQVKLQLDGIFISQDKYVADILKKFDFCSIKIATTPIESNKPLVKDKDGVDVDVHVYRSMIGSLMYLTASRPDIMFAVCACARFQVTPKASHLNAVKRIFRYLKHQPKLGLWYPRDSPFELEAFSDSDYGGASLDRWYRIFTKGQKSSKTNKTEHENEKSVKSQKVKSKSTKVNKVKVKDGAESKEILNGPTRTHLMGRGKRREPFITKSVNPFPAQGTIHSPSSPRLLHLQTKPSLSNLNPTHKKLIPCWQSSKFPFVGRAMTKDEGLRSYYLVNTQD